MKNVLQRTASGIIYLVILIGCLFLGKYAFGAVILLIGLLALVEFYDLTGISGFTQTTVPGIISGTVLFVLAFLIASQTISLQYLALSVLLPILSFILSLYSVKRDFIKYFSKVNLGILYIIIPLAIMNYLVFPSVNGHEYTHRIVLGILTLVWINDTGAYITGSTIGRHKLFPRISPKKSWEGFIGGTLLTILTAWLISDWLGVIDTGKWIAVSMIIAVTGTFGDLIESMLKRSTGVKDSGTIMPGHGGFLDRFDSTIIAFPLVFLFISFFG